ncbi:MAG: hypothetical protein DMF93_07435 [Acidobacteria bacterium]|nr:MAG: hypothetical protein DMF93_07435 [Acidobacteriota bacterium]
MINARADARWRNPRSIHHSAGSTTPITIASARPLSGSPSSGDSTRAGHRTAAASASVHSASERRRATIVIGGRSRSAAPRRRAS